MQRSEKRQELGLGMTNAVSAGPGGKAWADAACHQRSTDMKHKRHVFLGKPLDDIGRIMDLSEKMKYEIERLQHTRAQYERWLETAPEGSLYFHNNERGAAWLYRAPDSEKARYLSRTEVELAEKLALKRLYRARLKDIDQQIAAYSSCLKALEKAHRVEHLLERSEALRVLTAHYLYYLPQDLAEWVNADYEKNPANPENLKVPTIAGEYVRSKSERAIYNLLRNANLPFRYECKLELEHARRPNYPDFTILNPNNGKTYYYEHFGMMDDPNYQQDFLSKMRTFLNNGIYPGVNLIMSFETKDTPIDEVYVNHLLEYYFGNVMEKR